ncbi:MAG: ABC transporter permease [bacterium]
MPSPLELVRRLRYLVLRDRYTAELEEEMRLHIQHREARFRERGLAPGAARYAARRQFGNPGDHQERSRDMWGLRWLEHAAADVRFAVRRLRHRPGFTVATIAVAALGIGATTAVFSAVDAALFRPLPFARPAELVTLTDVNIPFEQSTERFPEGRHSLDINDAVAMRDVFASTAAFAAGGLNLSDPTNPRRVRVGVVTSGFFATLGAAPQVGRVFTGDEGRPHGTHAVVLSNALWQQRFGGENVIGKPLDLSGTKYEIVGVMGPGFNFPNESDLWVPLTVPTTDEVFAPFRGYLPSWVIARVAPGVSVPVASARLLANWKRLAGPPTGKPGGVDEFIAEATTKGAAVPLKQQLVGDREKAFVILMGATALLLLIACSNVANLLLSDAASRRREVALRELLGATRGRIVRQLLAESVLLAFAGTAVGFLLSPAALGVLRAMMPGDLAGIAPAELNLRVLAFATVLALVTGLVFGIWPALGTSRNDPVETIKAGASGGATAGGLGGLWRALITAEVALTVMLLVGSGLMLRSLRSVLSQELGASADHVGTLEISYPDGVPKAQRLRTIHAILDRLSADPAIQAAGVVTDVPLRGGGNVAFRVEANGAPTSRSADGVPYARMLEASGTYFKTLGIPLLRGRTLMASDDSLAPRVAVINMAMAKRWWANADPLGQTFRFGGDTTLIHVVGVVGDVREISLENNALPQVYLPLDRRPPENLAVVARSALAPSALLARITNAVHAADPAQAVYNVRMLDDVIATAVAPRRTNTMLIAIFGGIALSLSAFGVYGVVSYGVSRRAREFGIRAALGATGRNIAALVGGEMAWIVALGVALGLGGAWALSRVLASQLFGVDSHDAVTFVATPILLLIPAAIATIIPARRAMRVSPTEVMRAE